MPFMESTWLTMNTGGGGGLVALFKNSDCFTKNIVWGTVIFMSTAIGKQLLPFWKIKLNKMHECVKMGDYGSFLPWQHPFLNFTCSVTLLLYLSLFPPSLKNAQVGRLRVKAAALKLKKRSLKKRLFQTEMGHGFSAWHIFKKCIKNWLSAAE